MNHSLQQNVRARKLRPEMSVSEKVLWEQLRKKRLGYAFRYQVPVGPSILDFYGAQASLCIEVDGEQHLETQWKDGKRHANLRSVGIETLRIPSLDLFDRDAKVFGSWLDRIGKTCAARCSTPLPPPPHARTITRRGNEPSRRSVIPIELFHRPQRGLDAAPSQHELE
ncbi:MAG: DUF559 domain-containing protein [Fimbriimonadaceae bacterium]|nr:DUF559 domain-containing protein [Fimbriimonadaceae bacterium]